jgi:hypothetical protein
LYSGAKCVGKEAFKTDPNIMTVIHNKKTQEPLGDIFKTRFSEVKDNFEQMIKKIKVPGLGLKRKLRLKKNFRLKVNAEK